MNSPILSVCIPTYNRDACLKQCLESVTVQFKDSSIKNVVEVLVSDNGSIDNTKAVVEEFQKDFSNILYHKNPENVGFDRNALGLVERAAGKFVCFLGDDDAFFEGALSRILQQIESGKLKFAISNCWGYDNELLRPTLAKPNLHISSDQYFKSPAEYIYTESKQNLVGLFCGLSGQIFERELWVNLSGKEQFIGTNAIHLYTVLSAAKNEPFALLAQPLVKVRAANIRWDTFPGLETLSKRAQSTNKILVWILNFYNVPYSSLGLKIQLYKGLVSAWVVSTLRTYLFRNQKTRDLIKKILGK